MMAGRFLTILIISFILISSNLSNQANAVTGLPVLSVEFSYICRVSSITENEQHDGIYCYTYPSGDLSVRCEVAVPSEGCTKPYPTLVMCHGGITGIPNRMRGRALELAEAGYFVVMPSYRGEDGSEGEVEVACGEVDDVLACLDLLRDSEEVDGSRIALIGSSHGALIAVLAASRDKEIQAVVCAYGVMDIVGWWYYLQESELYEEDALSRRIYGGGPIDHPEEFARRSALAVACEIESPVLIIQGAEDRLVPPEQGESLAHAFRDCGKDNYTYRLYDGAGHGFIWYGNGEMQINGRDPESMAWQDIISFIDGCWHGH